MIRLLLFAVIALTIFSCVYGDEKAKTNEASVHKLFSKTASKAAAIKASAVQ